MYLSQITAQVSSQVRKELQVLFFGSGGSGEQQGEVPESLIYWLSQRYMSTPDLQASLASLELSILRNVSLQLELNRAQTLGEAESQAKAIVKTVTGTVQHDPSTEGLTEEVINVHFPLSTISSLWISILMTLSKIGSLKVLVCHVFGAVI